MTTCRSFRVGLALILLGCLTTTRSGAQGLAQKADAPLVVEGTVRQAFRSTAPGQADDLVQIEVARADARKAPPRASLVRCPAPGESMYVLVPSSPSGRGAANDTRKALPTVGAQVRVYLTANQQGLWQAVSSDWFESMGSQAGTIDAGDLVRDAVEAAKSTRALGMTTEMIKSDGRTMLRVTSVARGGAAQTAGLEVGDMIAAADGAEIKTANQLAQLAEKGKKLMLVVIDVNTDRAARVEIDPQAKPAATSASDAPPVQPPRINLGLSAEPVALGTRSALKVIRTDPDGPAAKAGIEPGDIVVSANGAPTTGVEQLLNALRKSGPTLKLTVRDSRTGRDVDVDVPLPGSTAAPPTEAEVPARPAAGKLGAVTELAFHDSDFAVKVTEVDNNSAAARAGLRPGVLIVSADGKPILHPNDLNDAVRQSKGTLRLTVVDPKTGRKSTVDCPIR